MGFTFSNGQYFPLIREVSTPLTSSIPLSDFLETTFFPVPVETNEFQVRMKANAKLKFEYILLDHQGNELYRKNFVLQQGHERDHLIRVNEGIPAGLLINKFIFEDGSELNITTMK